MQYFTVDTFWEWFVENSGKLHSNNYNRDVLHILDETISNWQLSWEIGPGRSKSNSLTISPGGNKELVNKSEDIIASAPLLRDWELYAFKQPKDNWREVKLVEDNIEIGASDWSYVLLEYPDTKKEVIIKANNIKQFDAGTQYFIVDLVLTHLLGEQLKMSALDFIELADDLAFEGKFKPLQFLPQHLEDVVK